MSGGKGPQIDILTAVTNWFHSLITGDGSPSYEQQRRTARQARIDEHHRRHPDAPEAHR